MSILVLVVIVIIICIATVNLDYFLFQIWNFGSPDPNFTLDGHSKGVNCIDYFTGGDKPFLISGSDDNTAKVFPL